MKKLLIMFFLIFICTANAEEFAGWGKVQWGMTKEDVISAYKENIKNIENNAGMDERIYLREAARAGDASFNVVFVIKDNLLNEVRLETGAGNYPEDVFNSIKGLLIQKYGQPDSEENNSKNFGGGLKIFHKKATWFEGKTTVILNILDQSAVIRYQPSVDVGGL